jgi:aldose 1-epimerase
MSVIRLSVGETCVDVAPDSGGRVAAISHRGVAILIGPEHSSAIGPLAWGCYPMVPWCGRIAHGRFKWNDQDIRLDLNAGEHAMHGTVFDVPWQVDDASENHVLMRCSLARNGWPFEGQVIHTVHIGNGHVSMSLEVQTGEAIPVQVGWHPWFVKPPSLSTTFKSMYERADDHSTTSHLVVPSEPPWDDCFIDGKVEPFRIGDVTVRLSSTCDHWVIYGEPTHATCIEPQSGPPNGVNIGHFDVVSPSEPMRHTFDMYLD